MKVQWNRLMAMCAFALVASTLAAADIPRSEWLGKIGDCAQNAATMKETMSNVSASDQVALVSEVNKALTKMAGSNEERAAAFVKANVAALTAAMIQNREKRMGNQVLAEIYATVPPEYLTVVSEQLAKTVLKRGNLSKEVFITISTNVLHAVSERLDKAENAGVREAFAAVTFLKALGEPASKDLISTMLSQMGDAKTRETAMTEWINPALGINGAPQSYDPMLGAANAGDEPDHTVVESLLAKDGSGTGNGGNAPANGGTNTANPANTNNNGTDGKVAGDGKTGDGKTGDGKVAGDGKTGDGKVAGDGKTGDGKVAGDGKTGDGAAAGAVAAAGTGNGAKDGTDGAKGGTDGAGNGADAGLHPVVVATTGPADITVALLGSLGATGTGMQTPIEQIGGIGWGNTPNGVGPNDLPWDINLNRTPRAYVNSEDAVGGGKDGKNSDGDDTNPYYKKDRGSEPSGNAGTGGGGSRPYRGQHLKAW